MPPLGERRQLSCVAPPYGLRPAQATRWSHEIQDRRRERITAVLRTLPRRCWRPNGDIGPSVARDPAIQDEAGRSHGLPRRLRNTWSVRSTSEPWAQSLPTTLPQFRHVAAWSAASARYRRATASGERGVTGVSGL